LVANKWYHIVTVIGTNGLIVYYNGTSTITHADTSTMSNVFTNLVIGNSEFNTHYFNGIIDNIAIWSCTNIGFVTGRSAKDIWTDAKMEISGWAKVVALGDGGWLKLQGLTKEGKVWGLYLDDYDTFYTIGGYMANRYADTTMGTNGLVANWLMDEPSWTNSTGPIPNGVVDSGPLVDKNHGTASGAVPSTDGKFNSAGEFDGVDNYIEISDDATLDFTAIENFTNTILGLNRIVSHNGSMPIVQTSKW